MPLYLIKMEVLLWGLENLQDNDLIRIKFYTGDVWAEIKKRDYNNGEKEENL